MLRFARFRSSPWGAALACAIVVFVAGTITAEAASGPFADFRGSWSGTGTMRNGDKNERVRCTANYRPQGSTGHEVSIQLRCNSDSYDFDLGGNFRADESNHVSGSWTEQTRGVGGTAVGISRGDRFQLHVESSAFSATMYITTRGSRQSVTFDAQGGGQVVKASITLSKR